MRAIDEELVLDITNAIYGSGIIIVNTNDVIKLDCSVKNNVLHRKTKYWGNDCIRNIQLKYKVDIKWLNDNECNIYNQDDYFKDNVDYRKIYNDYEVMTIDLKRLMINKPYDIWTLNDIDFFTTARKFWFSENPGILLIVCNDDEDCNCLDGCLQEPINEFMNKYGLERKYVDFNILGFKKI